MTVSSEIGQTRQGWIQTVVILIGLLATILLTFSRLDAKADDALKTAGRAEGVAADSIRRAQEVKDSIAPLREELVRIRTILDERLPGVKTGR